MELRGKLWVDLVFQGYRGVMEQKFVFSAKIQAELLVTVYGQKKDILFEKTAYEPRQTTQEVLKIWERNGIDVGEVATSSGVVVQNNGTGAKPPLSGPTSNNTIPQSPEKSSSNSENAETSRQTEEAVVGKNPQKKYSSACASYGGS